MAMSATRSLLLILMTALFTKNTFAFNCLRQNNRRSPALTRWRLATTVSNNDNSETATHIITWKTADRGDVTFTAQHGELLRTAALRRAGGVSPHNGRARLINCRGLGTCGTCAVEIDGGDDNIEPRERNVQEQLRLSFPPHGGDDQSPNLRLACQVQVCGDITVTKRTGFWGQYDELATKSEAETYFGDLEFLLDSRSPEDVSDKEGN